jgi:cytochrome c553
MRAIATSLSDKDIADLAAYYSGAPATTASK